MQVLRVQPRLRKEIVKLWEFLLETLQVDRERILPCNIVHSQEVIDSLVGLKLGEKLWRDAKVLPADLPIAQLFRIAWLKLLQLTEEFFVQLRHKSVVRAR